jgi:integrase
MVRVGPGFVPADPKWRPDIRWQKLSRQNEVTPTSVKGDRQREPEYIFKEAGIAGGQVHRSRDIFVVGVLQAGVPMDRVSVLLGHSNIKVTEKHYSPWVRARQEQSEADVRRTWAVSEPEHLSS